MKRTTKLTESDLNRIVKRVIKEQSDEMNPFTKEELDSGALYKLYEDQIMDILKTINDHMEDLEELEHTIYDDEDLNNEDSYDLLKLISTNLRHYR
jgi:hypothetical protein